MSYKYIPVKETFTNNVYYKFFITHTQFLKMKYDLHTGRESGLFGRTKERTQTWVELKRIAPTEKRKLRKESKKERPWITKGVRNNIVVTPGTYLLQIAGAGIGDSRASIANVTLEFERKKTDTTKEKKQIDEFDDVANTPYIPTDDDKNRKLSLIPFVAGGIVLTIIFLMVRK